MASKKTEFLDNNLSEKIAHGQSKIAEWIKLHIYKYYPSLLNLLDTNNDNIFLDPLLIAFFSSTDFEELPQENVETALNSLLYFHVSDELKSRTKVRTNENGIAYLSGLGYYNFGVNNTTLAVDWKTGEKPIFKNNTSIIHPNSKSSEILIGDIKIGQLIPDYLTDLFSGFDNNGNRLQERMKVNVPITELESNRHLIQKASDSLSTYYHDYYLNLVQIAKRIVLFQNHQVRNFAATRARGMIFLSLKPGDGLMFFICELVHQFGHNILLFLLHNISEYFKVDVNTPISFFNGNEKDYRTLSSAFHGLYTTTKTAECLNSLLMVKNVFKQEDQLELLGRFVDNSKRHRTGLELCDHSKIFTEKGLQLYYTLSDSIEKINQENASLIAEYNVQNQPFVYNHDLFLASNDLVSS